MRIGGPLLRVLRWYVEREMRRQYDVRIPGDTGPYLDRWYIWPRSARRRPGESRDYRPVEGNLLGVYVHLFHRSDEDRARHDHPRDNVSVLIRNSYTEHMQVAPIVTCFDPPVIVCRRDPGDVVFRRAATAHRVELDMGNGVPRQPVQVVSVFVTGPKKRDWGFWCENGWRPWREFTAAKPDGGMAKCD